ncbi:MAG TPA: PEP/pyruvate-binding domain-containing protein [Ktedonobacterales bacterium]|nr:PEP/pyruvate-binding domain-containing protein [Ktedonobacterales bacterium]
MTHTRTTNSIVWLDDPVCNDPLLVGGKAASLSRLAEQYPVPPGFALTTALFDRVSCQKRSGEDNETLVLSAGLRADIAAAYQQLAARTGMDDPAVAVRSSAVDEDGGDASFAGQHETFLNIVGLDPLLEAIGRCWESFTAPNAIEYRRKQGLPVEGVRVAVLVQQLVIADTSAVIFTADPVTGDRDVVVVNASWGLGESIVGGTVTPDVFVVGKRDAAVERRVITEKRRMTVAVQGGTTEVQVPSVLRSQSVLTEEQLAAMKRLGLALEAVNGRPVDIECAWRSGTLSLLQCRPITTLGHPRPEVASEPPADPKALDVAERPPVRNALAPPADFPVVWAQPEDAQLLWTLDRVHWPDPVPLLVFAIAGEALARGLTCAAVEYELQASEILVRRINTYRYQASVPIAGTHEAAAARRERSRQKLRAAMLHLRTTWLGKWLPEVDAHLTYWEHFDLERAPLPALSKHLDETLSRVDRLWEIHFLLSSPVHAAISQFGKLYQELFGGATLDAFRLLRGHDNKTILAGKSLWYLSRLAQAQPAIQMLLEGGSTEVIDDLGRSDVGRDFLALLRSYLEEYGQRREDLYLERPTWLENPEPVVQHLVGLMARSDRDIAEEMVTTWEESERLILEARRRLTGYPEPVREEFEFLLAAAHEAVVLSEDHNFWIDARSMYHVRRVFTEVGRRLAAAGVIAAVEDVFHLTVSELREALEKRPAARRQRLVEQRRAEVEHFGAIMPPEVLGTRSEQPTAVEQPLTSEGQRGKGPWLLHGHPGSPGVVRGPAHVVRSLAEAGSVAPGDVLVAETLSSSWTPLFAVVAGVVTDTGGILGHAAVVAREYGIPAVLGTNVGTASIREGQVVELDGYRGIVRIF